MNKIKNRNQVIERIEIDLLLEAIYQMYGYDFRSYARASIERRTRQFLPECHCSSISDMIGKILRDENVFSRMAQYYSISVTEFFRDPFVYRLIRQEIIPIMRTWPHLKIWLAGCATGEEVYSLAILLKEEGIIDRSTIYATDFNDKLLDMAQKGIYDIDKLQEATRNHQQTGGSRSFSEYYHTRYGAAAMDGSLKERIVFANHNLVTDGVFGEMQLIFCRNVLIYFNQELKNRVLQLFTDSLVHGGVLCLGAKETLHFTDVQNYYVVINEKASIYKKTV